MGSRLTIAAAILALLPGGAALAQLGDAQNGFYADPVLPDPPATVAHVYPPAIATADVAAVTPAATPQAAPAKRGKTAARATAACTALNPCAVATPARG